MSFEDRVITCADCGQDFVHSAEDQARYAERGFTNDPKRCRECREKRKARQQEQRSSGPRGDGPRGPRPPRREGGGGYGGRGHGGPRESHEVRCAACGIMTTVPFKPTGDRPVYCRDCYRQIRN